jgi:hypothetical protein
MKLRNIGTSLSTSTFVSRRYGKFVSKCGTTQNDMIMSMAPVTILTVKRRKRSTLNFRFTKDFSNFYSDPEFISEYDWSTSLIIAINK